MTEQSRTVLEQYQLRKTKRQKESFRRWLCMELEAAGYAPAVERSSSGSNVVVGDPERAGVLFTAHYDTQPVLPFPNFITPRSLGWYLLYQLLIVIAMFAVVFIFAFACAVVSIRLGCENMLPAVLGGYVGLLFCLWWLFFGKANRSTVNDNTSGVLTLLETALALPAAEREGVCFVFFDNEEKGMLGSAAFASGHGSVKARGLVINFDCVSDGDYIQFFPTKALKRDEAALAALERAFRGSGEKTVEIVRGFGLYPSDNAVFKRAAGVCALHRSKAVGYYLGRIHTGRDTVLEEENIRLLRDGALAYIHALRGETVPV